MGWAVPGWGRLLERLPAERAAAVLRGLDAVARRVPRWADYLLTVWRPRTRSTSTVRADTASWRVAAHDPAYRWKIGYEARTWDRSEPPVALDPGPSVARLVNACLTGDPARSWLDDLAARGPFASAAALGCDDENHAAAWLRAAASERLDVYELSAGVISRARAGIPRQVSFVRADLNFAHLPPERYDVVWSSGTLHHIVNLEHLLDEVAKALRVGGLFALHDYVGEARHQYDRRRLERANAALRAVPQRYRREGIETLSPRALDYRYGAFCAVRSSDVLPAARARFDVVHEGRAGALFPLFAAVDVPALEHEAPAILDGLLAAEREALRDPAIQPCFAYAVFRRR